ncbi:leucine--tRNA ligase [Candidatus Woesearchaeota archaeon]|nr:leucine--tRNA ligase [Candidatus Woesearchaeota archaeon]
MENKPDFQEIAKKWQKEWEENKVFEADANPKKKKFFAHFTYPYVNAFPHIGHFYTLMQADIMARYKRLQGFNVLLPQGWHATGSPILSAAQRVKEREEKQLKILASMGITKESELKKFEEPKHWIDFFAPEFKKDFQAIGTSTDWRRSYITTSLSPHYDKFIRWQFRKLKEKNYVIKGKFPVVWCPKDNAPVGDHDRAQGEGETPQEFVVMKYEFGGRYIAAATLRPETIFGDTNIWVNPDADYVVARVDKEKWIISRECAEKLKFQDRVVAVEATIKGSELVGKECTFPMINRRLLILPSKFSDPGIATGIVRSVPSHAPFDWAALNDLQRSKEECRKYNLNFEDIRKVVPISVISVPEMGEHPAVEISEKMGVKSQNDSELLDKATQELYRKEFFNGTMKGYTGKYAGMQVAKAKEEIKQEMVKNGSAEIMHELTGKVVCRCLTECTVKIVSDQWFIAYGSKEWKKLAHEALDKLKLYPEIPRQQLNNALDWLKDWACTREKGLGTRLPWDEKWLIESLSDSTIYFAFYPIAHLIQKIDPEIIDDGIFDYIMLGKGKKPNVPDIDKMRHEFEYWYPFDFNTSGKDLIQNHIAFSLFNHAAIFPKDRWPNGLRINGWVTINDEKMSKSLGNIILLRDIIKTYNPDAARLTIAYSGEGVSDPNWDGEFAQSTVERLSQLYDFCINNYNKGASKHGYAEKLLESQLNLIIKAATGFMEEAMFRSALQAGCFEMQRVIRQYMKLAKNMPNKKLISKAIECQLLMLAPFTPFICEEIWRKIGKKGFISIAAWPKYDESRIDKRIMYMEEIIDNTRKDVLAVLKLLKKENPKKIRLFVAEEWKYEFITQLKGGVESSMNAAEIIKKCMSSDLKRHGDEIVKLVPQLLKNASRIPAHVLGQETEFNLMKEAAELYKGQIKAEFEVVKAQDSKEQKSRQALPGKAAILVE